MKTRAILVLAMLVLLFSFVPTSLGNSATFQSLGSGFVYGISADGTVVVGSAGRWTESGGWQSVGGVASGASADGSVVVGYGSFAGRTEAFRWTESGGMQNLGDLLVGTKRSYAFDVSADGTVVVGVGFFASTQIGAEAFRWTESAGMQGLGDLPGGYFYSKAHGVSADGSIVVGVSTSASATETFRWTESTGMQNLGDLPGGSYHSWAIAVSGDGSAIVGERYSGSQAFRWTESEGMQALGDLPDVQGGGTAYDVSADGSVVVGAILTGDLTGVAFLWDEDNGMRDLKGVLEGDYGLDLTGWKLWQARGISDDGLTIVGFGVNTDGDIECWIVKLLEPAMTYYVDAVDGSDNNDGLSPETAFATIQKAIDSAYNGDTVLVADGTYTGPGNRDIDFLGKAITVRSESGPENCIINCNGTEIDRHRGFYFHNGEDANSILAGFTITNGYARSGGGIHCTESSPTITNCTISGNSAEYHGGGIYCWDSNAIITNCTITGNWARLGGGICCEYYSSPAVTNCTIIANSAKYHGGGIYCWDSNAIITNCTITGNSAGDYGGGISCWDSNAIITNCTIRDNSAYEGGGIYCKESNPTIRGCTITHNSTKRKGGGICCEDSNPEITNCIITNNIIEGNRDYSGGGVYFYCGVRTDDDCAFTITNSTISGNSAGYGGGISCYGSLTITNCNISGNLAGLNGGGIYCHGSLTITDCNISGNIADWYDGGGIYCDGSPTITDCNISGNIADWYGGGIYCWGGSPTITNCTITGNTARGTDGGGDGGGICCEYYSSPAVTNCTIIANSAKYDGGGIYCKGVSIATITNCTISGNSASSGGGINCLGGSVTISNCTFSGNLADGDGGGIYRKARNSSIFTNCTISGNLAGLNGGGIRCYGSNPEITNCILWANEAPDGPQVYLDNGANASVCYTNVQAGQVDVYVDEDCTLNWGEGNIDADPCFVELGYWADVNDPNIIVEPNDPNAIWVDGDYYLLPDSLCIDAGDPNYVAEPNETDLDGNPRLINGRIDMGTYETNYIQAAMKLTPQMLNCNSKGKYIKAHITLPEGFLPQDVDVNAPAVAEPMGIESEYIKVLGAGTGPVKLEICFDRETFCEAITETGEVKMTVIGSLTTSRYFYASDTIRIKPRR